MSLGAIVPVLAIAMSSLALSGMWRVGSISASLGTRTGVAGTAASATSTGLGRTISVMSGSCAARRGALGITAIAQSAAP
jgi:hypothetical protein